MALVNGFQMRAQTIAHQGKRMLLAQARASGPSPSSELAALAVLHRPGRTCSCSKIPKPVRPTTPALRGGVPMHKRIRQEQQLAPASTSTEREAVTTADGLFRWAST